MPYRPLSRHPVETPMYEGQGAALLTRPWFRWFAEITNLMRGVDTFLVTLNPASVAANTTSEQTFAVDGLQLNSIVSVTKPSHTTGLGIVNARVSSLNEVAITFMNSTAGAIDPGSEAYLIAAIRT